MTPCVRCSQPVAPDAGEPARDAGRRVCPTCVATLHRAVAALPFSRLPSPWRARAVRLLVQIEDGRLYEADEVPHLAAYCQSGEPYQLVMPGRSCTNREDPKRPHLMMQILPGSVGTLPLPGEPPETRSAP